MKTRAEIFKTLVEEDRKDEIVEELKKYGYEPAGVEAVLVVDRRRNLPVGVRFTFADQSSLIFDTVNGEFLLTSNPRRLSQVR